MPMTTPRLSSRYDPAPESPTRRWLTDLAVWFIAALLVLLIPAMVFLVVP
jgi:hypothetical protein